ncbi:MAG: hypothetical protein HY814_04990 [Candidatus Riflebacteria bacterium]|nr:hypothetical protein [Candidatus Riflebacteria bacterium]
MDRTLHAKEGSHLPEALADRDGLLMGGEPDEEAVPLSGPRDGRPLSLPGSERNPRLGRPPSQPSPSGGGQGWGQFGLTRLAPGHDRHGRRPDSPGPKAGLNSQAAAEYAFWTKLAGWR